jgi:hypothetical protein
MGTQKLPKRGFHTRELGILPVEKIEKVQHELVS